VYNETNECFLSLETRLGYSPFVFFTSLFRMDSPEQAYWIAPVHRLKTLGIYSPHDLVYLDQAQKIVDLIEFFPMPGLAPRCVDAQSLIVFPEHTIDASDTQAGNQLVICAPEEMEVRLRRAFTFQRENTDTSGSAGPMTRIGNRRSTGEAHDRRGAHRKRSLSWCAEYRNHDGMVVESVRDLSGTGLYLLTNERWPIGTRVSMTLHLTEGQANETANPVLVHLKVTRWAADGLGLEFLGSGPDLLKIEYDDLVLN
jgi:hypothetical protein